MDEKEERLQKVIAAAGIASRRKAEILVREGRVTVNGKVVTAPGSRARPGRDHIKVDGKLIGAFPDRIYLLLNKPDKVMSTVFDPQGRLKVTDFMDVRVKVYPVGRLDYHTEGLILLTNDGDFARIAAGAGEGLPKVYHAKVRSVPSERSLDRLRAGIRLPDGTQLAPCGISLLKGGNNSWFEVTLTQGKNRQIREMFLTIGNPVLKLRRVRIGFLTSRGLKPGHFRYLTAAEVDRILRLGRGERDFSHAGMGPRTKTNAKYARGEQHGGLRLRRRSPA